MKGSAWSGLTGAALALSMLGVGEAARAQEEDEIDARIFFELNDTDGDLGLHGEIEADEWRSLKIKGPNEGKGRSGVLLNILALGQMGQQGLAELLFEGSEPDFSELPPATFFARFPAGTYTIEAKTTDNAKLSGESDLSHVLPAAPGNVRISGVPAPADCDGPVPVIAPPIVISWDPVTSSHPTLGTSGPVSIESYELALELEILGEEFDSSTLLPPTVTSFPVSDALLAVVGGPYDFEILVRDANGNRTAIESCFDVP